MNIVLPEDIYPPPSQTTAATGPHDDGAAGELFQIFKFRVSGFKVSCPRGGREGW